jgi:hypothetical protein
MPFARLTLEGGMDGGIIGLGCAAGKDNLVWFGPEPLRYLAACPLNRPFCGSPHGMNARRVAPFVLKPWQHGIQNFR